MQTNLKPAEVAPYNFYRDNLPSNMDGYLKDSLFALNDTLRTERPKFIDSLAIHSRVWYYKPTTINIFVFGGFRSRYRALVQTAELLAEFYLQFDYLPLIQPLTNNDWEIQVKTDGRFLYALRKSSILIYSAEGN